MRELDEIIDAHWEYTKEIMELMYKRAFAHGYKHGLKQSQSTDAPSDKPEED